MPDIYVVSHGHAEHTRREVATRVGSCLRELMADTVHDHAVVTHGYALTFVITSWMQIPSESVRVWP
ncbi:hypothetical protein ACWF82_03295 [Nocardia sp. NPDC055053]